MRAELAQAKKETSFYLQKVEQAKAIDAMEERKRKRAAVGGAEVGGGAAAESAAPQRKKAKGSEAEAAPSARGGDGGDDGLQQVRRRFKQRKVVGSQVDGRAAVGDSLLGSLIASR